MIKKLKNKKKFFYFYLLFSDRTNMANKFVQIPVPGDGLCLIHSISAHLKRHHIENVFHGQSSEKIYQILVKFIVYAVIHGPLNKEYGKLAIKKLRDDTDSGKNITTLDQEPTAFVIAFVYNITIIIYNQSENSEPCVYNEGKDVKIYLLLRNEHFSPFVPSVEFDFHWGGIQNGYETLINSYDRKRTIQEEADHLLALKLAKVQFSNNPNTSVGDRLFSS